MSFSPISTKGIEAKLNELEVECDIFPHNERGKAGKSEIWALTNSAMLLHSWHSREFQRELLGLKTF